MIELKNLRFSTDDEPNRLIIELIPEEKISITLLNKQGMKTEYKQLVSDSIVGSGSNLPDHANLILDAMRGDKTNFLSFPEIIATWRVTDHTLALIKKHDLPTHLYADGSRGPNLQADLTQIDGFGWYEF